MERERLDAEKIKRINVFGSQFLYGAGGYRPKDMAQAQTSVPYAVAVYLQYGEVSDDLIHESMRNEEIAALSDRVVVFKDDEIIRLTEKDKSLWEAARVELITTDGRVFTETKISPDGDPESPLAEGAVHRKYSKLAKATLGEDYAEELWQSIYALEKEPQAGNPARHHKAVFAPPPEYVWPSGSHTPCSIHIFLASGLKDNQSAVPERTCHVLCGSEAPAR